MDVAAVAALFVESPHADDDDIVEAAVAAGMNRTEAELAVAFLPCAFGRVFIREQGWAARLPDEFQVENRDGALVRYRLSKNPVLRAAADLAEHYRHAHPPSFAVVAGRSAEVKAIHNALEAGSDVSGGAFSAVVLLRVMAEQIPQHPLRWWQRLRPLRL